MSVEGRSGGRDARVGAAVQHHDTVVIGGGQAGLAVGYHLKRRGIPFVILDASRRVGDAWRSRWDSLRLFTPARYDGLDGMAFPGPGDRMPSKDEMADYLETYAARLALPLRSGVRVSRVRADGDQFIVETSAGTIRADNVVVAMGSNQRPRIPGFAADLDPGIATLHSLDYRGPGQVPDGDVLVVGAGNSGAEIALELSPGHRVFLAGEFPGVVSVDIDSWFGRHVATRIVVGFGQHRLLTVRTPMGRRLRPRALTHGVPLIRTGPADLDRARVRRVPRMTGVEGGRPLLEDGAVLDVASVVWCTGFEPGLSWLDLDVLDDAGRPRHRSGIVEEVPGLYVVGQDFLFALSSGQVHGVSRDAARIAGHIAARGAARSARPHAGQPRGLGAGSVR